VTRATRVTAKFAFAVIWVRQTHKSVITWDVQVEVFWAVTSCTVAVEY